MGWLATPWPKMGWSGHPESPKKKKKKGRMGFGLWGWPDHPLGPGGGFGHHLPVVGVASATPIRPVWGGWPPLGQKWGGPATPFFGQGVDFFLLFIFILISFFFQKKKKN
jgi:hypothetical protein